MNRIWIGVFLAAVGVGAEAFAQQGGNKPADKPEDGNPNSAAMKSYDSKYYIIHTDLDADDEREAAIRMTKMAEEYHARTSDFSGVIRQKLPFFLFKNREDYYAAGGLAGSDGVFNGKQLMAIAGEHPSAGTWHIVQHEGFHQFANAVIGGQLPVWLNEGLAEYFGEAVFTGDSFISGGIPSLRLRRLRAEMDAPALLGLKSLPDLMMLSHQKWNDEMMIENYDQAWSVVYFLAHGEDGKYQKTFSAFMKQLSRGIDWQVAWRGTFGDPAGLEAHWREYWTKLPERPSDVLYARANVATLTSFLARCSESKQTFDSFEEYRKAIEGGTLKITDADWLPKSLIENAGAVAGRRMEEGAKYSLAGRSQQVVCELPDGTKLTGKFKLYASKVSEVTVDVVDAPAVKKPAK